MVCEYSEGNKKMKNLFIILCISCFFSLCLGDENKQTSIWQASGVDDALPEFLDLYKHIYHAMQTNTSYDIEQTIKVMNSLERRLQSSDNLNDFLQSFARMDLSNVAPDILKAKLDLLRIFHEMRLLEKENSDFQFTTTFITGLRISRNIVDGADVEAISAAAIGWDRAKNVLTMIDKEAVSKSFTELEKYLQTHEENKTKFQGRIKELRGRYFEYLSTYTQLNNKYYKEWDAMCLQKDKAYLDITNERFDKVYKTTCDILKVYPNNRETMLLNALSLTMMGIYNLDAEKQRRAPLFCLDFVPDGALPMKGDSNEYFKHATEILEKYISLYPSYSAPALVLRGIIGVSSGHDNDGVSFLDQASIEYPRQASNLKEMLELYQSRMYLNKSIEGKYLIRLYRSTMEGYGIFSPNLIKAGYYAQLHDYDSSKREIFNHFFRRGNQGFYDCLLSDMQFCDKFLDCSFKRMLPEHFYMDIVTSKGMFSDKKINVSINNRSNVNLQNVRIFLCLHLTDMYTDEYEIVKVKTKNLVPAMQKTDFEPVTLETEDKNFNDISHIRAIMMTDDAICWVDDLKYKHDNTIAVCKKMLSTKRESELIDRRLLISGMNQKIISDDILAKVMPLLFVGKRENGKMKNLISAFNSTAESSWKNSEGNLKFVLPSRLMVLEPVFTLRTSSGERLQPKFNFVDDSKIRLIFDEKPRDNDKYNLLIYTKYVACKLALSCTGDEIQVENIVLK